MVPACIPPVCAPERSWRWSIPAEGWGWDAARVIPGAALTGQAAGIAAALRCQNAGSSTASLYPKLAEVLQQAGLEMHL